MEGSKSSSFLFRSSKTSELFLIEVILPGGSIKQVYRNTITRTLVIQGVVDRVKWTIPDTSKHDPQIKEEVEILEIRIPMGFNFGNLGFVEKFSKGRVMFSFPSEQSN
jgi:hypothetical protein